MSDDSKQRLGRGLSALLGEDIEEPSDDTAGNSAVPIEHLTPGSHQPRRNFVSVLAMLAAGILAIPLPFSKLRMSSVFLRAWLTKGRERLSLAHISRAVSTE